MFKIPLTPYSCLPLFTSVLIFTTISAQHSYAQNPANASAPPSGPATNALFCGQPFLDKTASDKPSWRPAAGSDYLVLGYDVDTHSVHWWDYKTGSKPILITRNGTLLPVVYSREKVLVHICGLHPTDTVSISTNDLALPEQGADIRGGTPNAAVALAPTLDVLGTASTAGSSLSPAGFSFGAPPALSTSASNPFVAGSSKDGVSYTDATINISPETLALEYDVVKNNARDATSTIEELECGPSISSTFTCAPSTGTPGSIAGLLFKAQELLDDLSAGDQLAHNYVMGDGGSTKIGDLSLSGFNDYLARTQTLVTQINGLAAGVSASGLPARAVVLRQNFETILGVLTQVNRVIQFDTSLSTNAVYSPSSPAGQPPIRMEYNGKPAICGDLLDAIASPTPKTLNGPKDPKDNAKQLAPDGNPPDTMSCRAMELYTMQDFIKRYKAYIAELGQNGVKIFLMDAKLTLPDDVKNALQQTLLRPGLDLNNFVDKARQASAQLSMKATTLRSTPSVSDEIKSQAKSLDNAASVLTSTANATDNASQLGQKCTQDIDCMPKELLDLFTSLIGTDNAVSNSSLRGKLAELDTNVSQIFSKMNKRYQDSRVEQTDALPPLASNSIVRIGISVQRNYTPFTLSGGVTIGGVTASASASGQTASGGSGNGQQNSGQGKGNQSGNSQSSNQSSSNSNSASTTSSSGSNDITVLMEVHRYANFNLVGGAMGINVPTVSFATQPEYTSTYTSTSTTTGSTTTYTYTPSGSCNGGPAMAAGPAGSPTTSSTAPTTTVQYYCFQSSQTSRWQPAGMAGIEWFPLHRDYFPRDRGASIKKTNWVPSLLVASSVTSLGSFFIGPNFEPVNGLNFFAGGATAHQSSFPKGVSPYTVYWPVGSSSGPPALTPATHLKPGLAIGVGFDLSVFTQLFGKTQGPSLP